MSQGRKAFIGLSGPIGYDYRHGTDRVSANDTSAPNPVLEDLMGLLICYDELWFLSPHFCPADMRELPYVRFVNGDASAADAVTTAISQFREAFGDVEFGRADFGRFTSVIKEMTGKRYSDFAIDNHTHGIELFPGFMAGGNSANLLNVAIDAGIAAALDEPSLDVVSNSMAIMSFADDQRPGAPVVERDDIAVAALIPRIAAANFLGPKGAYHEGIEDLRAHRYVTEFREHLADLDHQPEDAARLAQELQKVAARQERDVFARALRGRNRYVTAGKAAASWGGNFLVPGAGSALSKAVGTIETLKERYEMRKLRWALFVVDASLEAEPEA